jgi:glycosyltransferase involved in cell wall biosynthesis
VEPALGEAAVASAVRGRLERWLAAGWRLTAPAPSAARALESALGLGRGEVAHVPLPHPAAAALPEAPPAPPPHLLVVRPPYEVFLPALRALWSLTGDRPYASIAAVDAGPYVDPGGLAQRYGLMGGHDVGAVEDWRATLWAAAVVVWFPAALDAGHELREALATGRPVVAPFSPVVRDHLRACGAPAYVTPGLHDPVALAAAMRTALTDVRGPRVGASARAAVLGESWQRSAEAIVRAVAPRPARTAARPRARGDRLAVALVDAQGSSGGGERLLSEIVVGLCRHPSRPDVRLVCVDDPEVAFAPPLRAARAAGATVLAVPREEASDAARAAIAEADVGWQIWAQTQEPYVSDTPIVATIHDIAWRHFDIIGGAAPAVAEAIVRGWVALAAATTCSSRFIRDDIEDLVPEAAGRITVIPLTAPRADPLPSESRLAAVRQRYALPPRFLLSPAPRGRHKNYAVLVSALDRLRRAGRPVTVVATGGGTDHTYWGPDLLGLGYVPADDLAAIRVLASGVVQTTLYEAGSFAVFEAMRAGLPVACSAIPPLLEQLERDGVHAETFDPADPEALARALQRVWHPSSGDARRYSANSALVGRRSWVDVAGDYLAVLERVARRGG